MAKLTAKQQCFVAEYLIDLNATQAAIRAGYSPKYADREGHKLVENSRVSEHIERAKAERSKRTGVSADRVIEELAKVAFLNPVDVVNMDEATIKGEANRDDTACISSVRVKIIPTPDGTIVEREVKTYNKLDALKQLGQHLGIFEDKINVSGDMTLNINVDYGGEPDSEEEEKPKIGY